MIYHPGDIIKFTYQHQSVDANTGDKYKEVLVLHPNWHNKIHGIDLKRLDPRERRVLEFLLDPKMRDVESKIPLINRIRATMDPVEEIQNPQAFYTKFIKPFLRRSKADAYRQYIPKLMSGVTRVRDGRISTGKPRNKKPLFGDEPNTLAKPGQTSAPAQQPGKQEPAQPQNRTPIDIMKAQSQDNQPQRSAPMTKTASRLSPSAAQAILKRFGLDKK